MAAPTATPRVTPTGLKMPEGFKALITLANKPSIKLWERDVKPPAIDGGEMIDTTTQHNTSWHTGSPRVLKKMTEVTGNCGYNPSVIADIISQVNVAQVVTITFPNAATWCFYGFLQKWEPSDLKEGEFPMSSIAIPVTNYDPVGNIEAGPVLVNGSGT